MRWYLFLLLAAIVPSAIAKHKPEKPADSATVVAHLLLPGAAVSRACLFLSDRIVETRVVLGPG